MTTEAPQPTPEPKPLVIPEYELTASRRGYIKTLGKLETHQGRLDDLPAQPHNMDRLYVRGTYWHVSQRANRLNEAQIASGYLDYLYAPEPRKLTGAAK